MSHVKVDVEANELIEMPVMPDGTVVTFQISGEPEIKESNATPGTHYLNVPCDVIKAADPKHVGLCVFHMVTLPSTIRKKKMIEENKTKGWKMVCNDWAIFCSVLKIDKSDFDTQRAIGKKFKGAVKVEEYQGRKSNKISQILEAA